MKILLKKEVCGSHEQYTEPIGKAIKKKKKKEADIDVWTWKAIQTEPEYNTSLHDSYYYNNIFNYYKKIMTEIQVL